MIESRTPDLRESFFRIRLMGSGETPRNDASIHAVLASNVGIRR